MIDFYNRVSNIGLGFFWTNGVIAKSSKKKAFPSSMEFYGGLGFFQTWNAKGSTSPTGTQGKYRTLLGVGV